MYSTHRLIELLPTVLIVGGGPAACATALSFLKSKPDGTFVIIDDCNGDAFKVSQSNSIRTTSERTCSS